MSKITLRNLMWKVGTTNWFQVECGNLLHTRSMFVDAIVHELGWHLHIALHNKELNWYSWEIKQALIMKRTKRKIIVKFKKESSWKKRVSRFSIYPKICPALLCLVINCTICIKIHMPLSVVRPIRTCPVHELATWK